MRKNFLLVGLILLLAVPLMLALDDFTREVFLASLLHLIWTGRLYLNSIPQPLFWTLFLVIALVIAVRSLIKRQARVLPLPEAVTPRPGRVRSLMQAIHRTSQGVYFKWRFMQHMTDLTLETLAHRERRTPKQMKQYLKSGRLDVPPEIEAYLLAGLTPALSTRMNIFTKIKESLQVGVQISPFDLNPEILVQFLESQMEIEHDD